MATGIVKIRYEKIQLYPSWRKPRKKRPHSCLACGAPLTDPVSIARGYGKRCWEDIPVKMILEIPEATE